MCLGVRFDDATESTGVQGVFEFPEGVAGEIRACPVG